MIFDWKLNNGLVFGVVHEQLYVADEEEEEIYEVPCICIHLSFFTLLIIFQ